MFAGHPVTSVARMFFTRVGAAGWAQMPLAAQCALPLKDRRVVGWLIVTGRLRPSPDYLVACRPYLGEVAAHHHRAFHARFAETSAGLGFGATVTRLQWSALAKVTALAGLAPDQVTQAVIDEGRQALTAAIGRHRPGSHGPGALSAALFGLQTTLFHLGVLDAAPRKTSPDRSAERAAQWQSAAPLLASTLAGYIAQVRLSLRASTMVRVEGVLREFACWLAGSAPEVALRRRPSPPPHRVLQAAPGRPAIGPRREPVQDQPRRAPRRPARLLRAAHRVGRRRRPRRRAGLLRRPAAPRRAAAPVPRRRRVHQAAAGHPRRPRPVRPPGRGIPGPHRPAQRRVPRPHRRLRRADRRRLLAARAARQAPHRPLHPAAPPAQRPPRHLARRTGPPACAPPTCSPSTASGSARAASTGPSPKPRRPPGSVTSARTGSGTRWPPRPSTGA